MKILYIPPKIAIRHVSHNLRNFVTPHNTILAMSMAMRRMDEDWDLIRRLMVRRKKNIAGHFRLAGLAMQNRFYSRQGFVPFSNGITKFSGRYYVVAEDPRNGNKSIYWANSPEKLAYYEIKNEDGTTQKIFKENNGRYFWEALPLGESEEENIEDSMRKHDRLFRKFHKNHATSYGGNVTDQHSYQRSEEDQNENDLKTYGQRYEVHAFSNDDYAMAVRENSKKQGGRWSIEIASRFERFHKLRGFVEIDHIPFFKKLMKAIFSNGYHASTHNSREEAFATFYLNASKRSRLNWSGKDPLNEKKIYATKLFTTAWNLATRQIKSPENHNNIGFDAGVNIFVSIASKTILRFGFFSAFTFAIAVNHTMRKASQIAGFIRKEWGWYRKGAHSADPLRAPYIEGSRANVFVRKLNTNIDKRSNQFMNVLSGHENDISYDNQSQKSPKEPFKLAKKIANLGNSGFANLFSPIDDYTATEIYFNGYVRLARRDPKTRNLTFYVKYIKTLDVNDKISLGDDVKNLLKDGKIRKIHHVKNLNEWKISEISHDDMEDEICPQLFGNYERIDGEKANAAKEHISWLFNNQSECSDSEAVTSQLNLEGGISTQQRYRPYRNKVISKIIGPKKEIEKPSKALVAFFKDCVFPYTSTVIEPFIQRANAYIPST